MMPTTFLVTCHTDHVGAGSTFVAIKGMKEDGIQYIPVALQKGATTIVVDNQAFISDELYNAIEKASVTLIKVENTRLALAHLSAQAYNFPARKLKIIAVTGTKGKSTTAFLLEHILKIAGFKTALLSTVKNRILSIDLPTKLTTQQPDYLHAFFSTCVQQDIEYVVMEVAAQAHSLHRIAGLEFESGIFTNFSQEHAEFYQNLNDYFAAKVAILEQIKDKNLIVLNADDEHIQKIMAHYPASVAYSCTDLAHYNAQIISNTLAGLNISINNALFSCPALVGDFNAYNIAAAVALADKLSVNADVVDHALKTFDGVPGRLEKYILSHGITAFIDYAHNPASYQAVLGTLKKFTSNLIVVFGCGGERDATKRPLMGAIASELAQTVILTSDNPRSEDPVDITAQICAGIAEKNKHKVLIELDRQEAIKKAHELSRSESIIVLLGKGPDEYQLIKGIKYPFSEKAILKALQ